MTEVSATRLYLGNLPRTATKADIEAHFATHGTGEITEVKLMNGFGFIEYKDPMDARDVVPGDLVDNVDFLWLLLYNLSLDMDLLGYWTQDLKDFARQSSLDVVYSETGRDSNGRGFVEFESAADLRTAVEKLDGREFKGSRVQCVADTQPDIPASRGRSRSPGPGRRPYPGPTEDYDRRQPPRGYSPRRDAPYGYRDRSPRRDYYDDRGPRAYRSPPRRPAEDYPPARGRYDDPYRRDYAPPQDPYANGRPYERAPRDYPPQRDAPYPREGYPPREYERGGRYW
ncbi:unnamed protein product [Clonostachys solani]|uniref:RRM domain-containing protein n=1 Tax=Clonostachys solani TaxID=160281 RepID=A0A9N9ZIW5_9HYPO|nr:unnamed protein product [Clonostachys solani]